MVDVPHHVGDGGSLLHVNINTGLVWPAPSGGGAGGGADRVAVGDEVARVEVHHDHAPGPPRPSQYVVGHVPVCRYL